MAKKQKNSTLLPQEVALNRIIKETKRQLKVEKSSSVAFGLIFAWGLSKGDHALPLFFGLSSLYLIGNLVRWVDSFIAYKARSSEFLKLQQDRKSKTKKGGKNDVS